MIKSELDIHSFLIHQLPVYLQKNKTITDSINKLSLHGHFQEWLTGLLSIRDLLRSKDLISQIEPNLNTDDITLSLPCISNDAEPMLNKQLETALMKISPWRKGPFQFFHQRLASEWRCQYKWERLKRHTPTVENKRILDLGSGNGYFGFRMIGSGAKSVIGCDPSQLYWCQFSAVKLLQPELPIFQLPLPGELLNDANLKKFDQIYSMGVIYHRKSPLDHLFLLKKLLKHSGHLILETLYVDGPDGYCLTPRKTYAKMPNVWFIPSLLTVESWLKRVGFKEVACVNTSVTQSIEQAATEWMSNESLDSFLSKHQTHTVEGYPRPQRAIFVAQV